LTTTFALVSNAFDQARRLGHQWVGREHVVLALLDDGRPSGARDVLNELGVRYAEYRDLFAAALLKSSPPIRSSVEKGEQITLGVTIYQLMGWVDGYCQATGLQPQPEVMLLGLCCETDRRLFPGEVPAQVIEALVARGVPRPSRPLPDSSLARGRHIDVPCSLIHDLVRSIRGRPWFHGFNIDRENDHAWVSVDDTPETAALVAAELERLARS
jgi:hypothetical protein